MKKVKYLALVLLLVLGLIGGAYAAWSETIVISGRVVTGNIDPVFSAMGGTDDKGWEYTHPEGGDWPDDFYTYQFLADNYNYSEDFQILSSGKLLRVRLFNTFPDLIVRKFFTVTNNGTAPVKIKGFELDGNSMGSPADAYVVDATELRVSLHNHAGGYDWETADEGLVIGAGESLEFFLSVHTLPTAAQSNTVNYTLGIVWEVANPADLP